MGFCSINFVYSLILLLGSFSCGYVLSYPSPAVPEITQIMNIKEIESTLFNAISSLFAIVGSLLSTFLINSKGKKITAFITSLVGCIFWIALSFMTRANIWAGIVGRAILGIFMGSISVVIPLCINELAPIEYKSIYGSLSQFGLTVGCTIVNFISLGLNWRNSTFFDGAICGLLCILIWFVPIKPNEPKNEDEDEVKESIFQRKYVKKLLTGIGAMFFQQFSGVNGILTNLNTLFEQAGMDLEPSIASGIAASAQVIAVVVGGLLIQKFGRRNIWVFSSVGAAVSVLLYGLTTKFPSWPSWIAIIFIFLYMLIFGVGLGPIPWFIVPQLFHGPVKSTATSIATAFNWLFCFIVLLCFPYLNSSIGDFASMLVFTIICSLAAVFGWFLMNVEEEEELVNNNNYSEDFQTESESDLPPEI